MSTINEEPPAKRQNRSLGASDRITVDVGGTKFITSVSTLTSNSTYFASLLSGNWSESGDNEIFLDRNPSAFSTLIEYMREGMIKVDDIDESVLALAEFLGVERLLLAVKVRWYHNIGRGPVHSTNEEIAAAFDQRYGGIRNAISAGLFPYFLKQDDTHAEKDFAVFSINPKSLLFHTYGIKMIGEPDSDFQSVSDIIGALNSLHMKGYNVHESQLQLSGESTETLTFSRRRHFKLQSEVTGIFIPDHSETNRQQESKGIKQFAMLQFNRDYDTGSIVAPAETQTPSTHETIEIHNHQRDSWLERNGFMTREVEYEDIFKNYFSPPPDDPTSYYIGIFSRMVVHEENRDQP